MITTITRRTILSVSHIFRYFGEQDFLFFKRLEMTADTMIQTNAARIAASLTSKGIVRK